MRRRIAIKNHIQEIQLIFQRCVTLFILMIILISLLIFRLGYLQLANHAHYTTLSKKNWLDLVPLEPTRGLIFDRNNILLAENVPVFSLDVIPDKIRHFPKMLSEISKIVPLSDNDIAQFQKQLKQHRRFDEVTLKLRLTEEEVARFAENQYHFPGVFVKARLIRHYPFENTYSHVLGYVGRINAEELSHLDPANYSATNYIGKLGIEKYYENRLHGSVGYEQVENDASGEPVRSLNRIKPLPGKNLYLTIDNNLQLAVEQALFGHRGAVVAIQPSTGEILAMVSDPSFDPNLFVMGMTNLDYKVLQESPDRPLYNRVLRGLYPPASTIKPLIALAGLDAGVTSMENTIHDPGWYQLETSSHKFHDWRFYGHGSVNLTRAIRISCDTYFFDLAHKLGIRRIDNILDQFGFGQSTGIDMEEELVGVVSSPEWKKRVKGLPWYEGDTLISGIGQGNMQATPLQLAAGISTIANRGLRVAPHLLMAEQDPGKSFKTAPITPLEPVLVENKSNWSAIIHALQQVIISPEGTGYRSFKGVPYTIAGKTGTAQLFSKKHYDENDHSDQSNLPERLRNHSLFVAFAPIDQPKIALAVVIENSNLAPIIAREIFDYYLLNIPIPNTTEINPGEIGIVQ